MQTRSFIVTLILIVTLSSLFTPASSQIVNEGPQVSVFYSGIDDSEQPFGLYVPPGYNPEQSYPLVIMLHGAMSNHRLALKRVFGHSNLPGENDAKASRYFPDWKPENYIVATPYARGTMGYMGIPEEDVYKVIETCQENFNIDRNRIYLTGLSMGGGGTLYLGMRRPDLFAAIAPVCPAPPSAFYPLIGNALNLSVAIHQGGADPVVRAEGTRFILNEFQKNNTLTEYYEYPGVQHDSWVQAYGDANIFRWFDGQTRNPYPDRVRYATEWYKYNRAYWVKFDKLKPGTHANIDARFTAKNNVEVKAENLEAFTLELKGHPMFDQSSPLTIKINGTTLQSQPRMNHYFTLSAGKWVPERYEAPVGAKQHGLEGPVFAAFTNRHVVVYGTQGTTDAAEITRRRNEARELADYSIAFGNYSQPSGVNPRVISDREVTPDDHLSSNLVLVGTKETNSVIAGLAEQLPVHLKPESVSEFGMIYGVGIRGRMVVVASGVPFWNNIGQYMPPAPPQPGKTVFNVRSTKGATALMDVKDLLLVQKSGSAVVVDTYLENDWKVAAGAKEKLLQSGAVTVND